MLRVTLPLVCLALFGSPTSAGEKRLVGYFAEWGIYGRKYNVGDIPAEKLTHINYAFARITNGECVLFDLCPKIGLDETEEATPESE